MTPKCLLAGLSPCAQQQVFLGPTQLLDGRFTLEGPGLGRLRFRVGQPHGKPAAGVSRRLAGSVDFNRFERSFVIPA